MKRRRSHWWIALALSAAACGSDPGVGAAAGGEKRKSPFATGNVTVAPQIEGSGAAPTPIPAPRPPAESTP